MPRLRSPFRKALLALRPGPGGFGSRIAAERSRIHARMMLAAAPAQIAFWLLLVLVFLESAPRAGLVAIFCTLSMLTGGLALLARRLLALAADDSDTGRTRGENDLPAVRVTVERSAGINGGPVAMTFGRIFGTDSMNSAATATAVHGLSPSMAPEGTMSPFAISGCMFGPASDVWDPVAQAPIGQPPKKFIIASGAANNNHCDVGAAEKCYCGQWASSDGDNPNSANAMRNRIIDLNENPLHVSTGGQVDVIDETYIAPGVMSSLYDTAEQYWTGKTIRVAVVQDSAVLGTSGPTPVQGFACLHVYKVVKNDNCTHYENEGPLPGALGGNGKGRCFVVSLSNELSCRMPGGGAPGPGQYTGIPLPPRLVE